MAAPYFRTLRQEVVVLLMNGFYIKRPGRRLSLLLNVGDNEESNKEHREVGSA